jgi:ATP-dependent Lhr-like helicase
MEASALRHAAKQQKLESKPPVIRAFDVLCQYLVTLAVGEGFYPDKIYEEVKGTFCFASITNEEWLWALHFITKGGASLYAYDEFKKVSVSEAGLYHVSNRKTAMRHRLSIGTIVSDVMLMVKWMQGGLLGMVEEWFVARLKTGSVFWFAGKSLEIVQIKEMTVYVRKVNAGKAIVPQWMGGRMPLSSKLGETLREGMNIYVKGNATDVEYFALEETLQVQQQRSLIPAENELLIEKYKSRDGHHVFIYPFEGRLVHEGLASLFAYRIGRMLPITFSLAFNDYGFELLSDQPIPIEDAIGDNLFGEEDLFQDVMSSINAVEMAGRKFRDIAHIAGLIFTGYPGKTMQGKHLQASAGMFFQVFRDYEPDNLLMKQAYEEVLNDQLEELRLREALNRINQSKISIVKIEQPSPFCFPIMVDRLREKMSSETLAERIRKMQAIQ